MSLAHKCRWISVRLDEISSNLHTYTESWSGSAAGYIHTPKAGQGACRVHTYPESWLGFLMNSDCWFQSCSNFETSRWTSNRNSILANWAAFFCWYIFVITGREICSLFISYSVADGQTHGISNQFSAVQVELTEESHHPVIHVSCLDGLDVIQTYRYLWRRRMILVYASCSMEIING